MAKPVVTFVHSTDVNFSSGPANGFPTKVVIPSAAQGFVPGEDVIPEYLNDILNVAGQYSVWVFDGSPAGAADAHIVETDANGDTNVRDLGMVDLTASGFGTFAGDVASTGGDVLARTGLMAEGFHRFRTEFHKITWPAQYDEWSTGGSGSSTVLNQAPPALEMTSGPVSTNTHNISGGASAGLNRSRGYVFETIMRITSAITTVRFEVNVNDTSLAIEATANGCAVAFDTSLADTNWTLVGAAASVTTRSAGSVAVVQNVWHRFRVEVAADGSAELFIDGVSEATIAAGTVGTGAGRFQSFLRTDTGADRTAEIERIEWWQSPSA